MTEDVVAGERVAQHAIESAQELEATKRWSSARDRALDEQFEAAARDALSRHAFEERTARLKIIGRRLIPRRLRPATKAMLARLDIYRMLRVTKRVFSRASSRQVGGR